MFTRPEITGSDLGSFMTCSEDESFILVSSSGSRASQSSTPIPEVQQINPAPFIDTPLPHANHAVQSEIARESSESLSISNITDLPDHLLNPDHPTTPVLNDAQIPPPCQSDNTSKSTPTSSELAVAAQEPQTADAQEANDAHILPVSEAVVAVQVSASLNPHAPELPLSPRTAAQIRASLTAVDQQVLLAELQKEARAREAAQRAMEEAQKAAEQASVELIRLTKQLAEQQAARDAENQRLQAEQAARARDAENRKLAEKNIQEAKQQAEKAARDAEESRIAAMIAEGRRLEALGII